MPADAREQVRQLPSGKWQLRYYDRKGVRHSGGAFLSKSAARAHYRDVIEPGLNGKPVARRDLTYSDLVELFLERQRDRRETPDNHRAPLAAETVRGEVRDGAARRARSGWLMRSLGTSVGSPERLRYPMMAAMRQALKAGVRYGYLTRNPAKLAGPNPMPAPREIRVYTAAELKAITDELGTVEAAAWRFAAATGSGPAEWAAIERRDVDKARRSTCGARRRPARAGRCRLPVCGGCGAPLGPASLDSRFVFTTTRKVPGLGEPGPFDVANFRRRVWGPATTLPASRHPRGSTTHARRSPRMRSRPGSRLRARQDHGHIGEDDRAALRDPDRHGTGRHPLKT